MRQCTWRWPPIPLPLPTKQNMHCAFATPAQTGVLTDEEFDAAVHKVLGAAHLSQCITKEDKLRFLFHEFDPVRSMRAFQF